MAQYQIFRVFRICVGRVGGVQSSVIDLNNFTEKKKMLGERPEYDD